MPRDAQVSPTEGSFLSHSNYIRAFTMLAGFRILGPRIPKVLANLADKVRLLEAYQQIPRTTKPDLKTLRKILANAWGTETILALSARFAEEDELIRITNTLGVVQLYYCCYHSIQALEVAKGNQRPTSHPKTQNLFTAHWVDHNLSLPPWSFGLNHKGFRNVARETEIDGSIHAWTNCTLENYWSIAAKALVSTRRDILKQATKKKRLDLQRIRVKEWKDLQQARIAAGKKPLVAKPIPLSLLSTEQKRKLDLGIGSCSFMDYLWRLRVKANYEDATMFTEGPPHEGASRLVLANLIKLSAASLLVHELFIGKYLGKDVLLDLADEWVRRNLPAAANFGLALRRDLLK
jgi:hypothetical protein